MGPFITAFLRTNTARRARAKAEEWTERFADHLNDAGLGHVSEIFDAEPPHEPRGCIAQAWSVAELLRAMVEDVRGIRPAARRTGARRAAFGVR
jgi:glycogen debranching enzyme